MNLDWTHKSVTIDDIRKVRKFYILSINNIDNPIFVDQSIFEGRMASYYLRNTNDLRTPLFEREEVLGVDWNMVITKGFFYKLDRDAEESMQKIEKDADKYYISFLEINGPLGMHVPN